MRAVAALSPIDPARKEVNTVFERALVFMHKVRRERKKERKKERVRVCERERAQK